MPKFKDRKRLLPLIVLTLLLGTGALLSCKGKSEETPNAAIAHKDTLRVATIYGPASFFSYRDTLMGYDYDFMEALAADHDKSVRWVVARSIDEAVDMAVDGDVDLIAAPIPVDEAEKEWSDKIVLCGPTKSVDEVLIQPQNEVALVNLPDLKGHTIYVIQGSDSEVNLRYVDRQIGGGINIVAIDPDSLAIEDMLAEVADGSRGWVATDRETAKINKTYHPELQITLSLSSPQNTRWGVAMAHKELGKAIDQWCAEGVAVKERADILYKYLDAQKVAPVSGANYDRDFKNGYASPYDPLFKAHAEGSRWDWRLLAAQGYTESRFDSTARSFAGASGVMQIMPGTARDFGLKKTEMKSPARSIETAVKILDRYDQMMADKVPDPEERTKFALAAYNAGPGHVLDAINLAKKYGYDPTVWDGNVEKAMLMKMNRKYYRDPVVKFGYSRGRETVDYVNRIYKYYDQAVANIHKGDAFETTHT